VLAYASLYDAEDVTATLAYPVRMETWMALHEMRQDTAHADLFHGGRHVRLEVRGLPFGGLDDLERAGGLVRGRT
jgi:hypothetical protein